MEALKSTRSACRARCSRTCATVRTWVLTRTCARTVAWLWLAVMGSKISKEQLAEAIRSVDFDGRFRAASWSQHHVRCS